MNAVQRLNRPVRVDGVLYPIGTDVRTLPLDAQPSIIDTGWTIATDESDSDAVPAADVHPPLLEPGAVAELHSYDGPDEPAEATPEADAEAEPVAETQLEQPKENPYRPLSELGIDEKLLALLRANDPPIESVQDAINHVAQNKSFRTVPGIGKAGNADLMEKLGL